MIKRDPEIVVRETMEAIQLAQGNMRELARTLGAQDDRAVMRRNYYRLRDALLNYWGTTDPDVLVELWERHLASSLPDTSRDQ